MATQKEIDDLLNDDWEMSQSSHPIQKSSVQPPKPKHNYEQSYSYANQQFDEYEESKRTQNFQSSQSQSLQEKSMRKEKGKSQQKVQSKKNELTEIKQEKSNKKPQPRKQSESFNKTSQNYIKPALELRTQSAFNKRKPQSSINADKLHLAHNYARLQERERELLFSTLSEQNKKLKAELTEKNNALSKIETKYKILLSEKAETTSTAKQLALQKKVATLKTKLEQMSNLQKIAEDRQKYKSKISKNPGNFIPEEEANRREEELLQLIDKLKARLLQSDENMGVLQKKLSQGVQHNDELHRKIKRVEQLQYKIQKLTEQAETDRGYIDILKEKIKELEKQKETEKAKYRKLELELKRSQMGQLTHSDILKELEQTRKQKQLLEKSLKEMSSAMMTNVRKNYQSSGNNSIQDSNQLLQPNRR